MDGPSPTRPVSGDGARAVAWGDELRAVHRRLRDALELARESLEGADPPGDPTADLLVYCRGFCAALDGHHRSEDSALFPEIVAARPDLQPVIDNLRRDHSMIDHLIQGLRAAMDRGLSTEEQIAHLDGIEAVMETHFRYEERQLIAVLDAVVENSADRNRLFGAIA